MQIEDRRIQKTRNAIDGAFWELMKEKGFEAITVGDVAERANINRATFYHHYADKYEWLDSCIYKSVIEVINLGEELLVPNGEQQLLGAYRKVFEYLEKNADVYIAIQKCEGESVVQARSKQVLVYVLREAALRCQFNPEEFGFEIHFLTEVGTGIVDWWIKNGCPISPDEMAYRMYHIHMGMIKGKTYIK